MSFLVKDLSIEVINLIFADYCQIEDILRFDNAVTNYRLRKAYIKLLPMLKLPLDLIRFNKTQLAWVSARKISIGILKIAKGARSIPAGTLSEMKCPTLTDVNLSCVNHVATGQTMVKFCQGCPNLQKLVISNTAVKKKQIYGMVRNLSNLKELNLMRCSNVDDKCVSEIANHLHGLETINLIGCPFTDASLEMVGAQFSNLKSIHLWSHDRTAVTFNGISSLLSCTQLEEFRAWHIDYFTEELLLSMIQLLPLKVFELMYCHLPVVDGEHGDDAKNGTAVDIIKEILFKSTPALETVTFIDCLAIKAFIEQTGGEHESTLDQVIQGVAEHKMNSYEADLPLKIKNFTFTLSLWDEESLYTPNFQINAEVALARLKEDIESTVLPLEEVLNPTQVTVGTVRINRYMHHLFYSKAIENIQRLR